MEPEERQLSDRERTVLLLAAEGLTDKEIAKHLILSQRTIGTYWERMRLKLGPFSRTQLVARFIRSEAEIDAANRKFNPSLASCRATVEFLAQNSTDYIARFDAEFRCLWINPALATCLGKDGVGFDSAPLNELAACVRPLDVWQKYIRLALETGESQSFDSEICQGEASRTHLLPEPSVESKPGTILAITTRRPI